MERPELKKELEQNKPYKQTNKQKTKQNQKNPRRPEAGNWIEGVEGRAQVKHVTLCPVSS